MTIFLLKWLINMGRLNMNIFKKLDGIFFHSFLKRMEDERQFLMTLKSKNMSIDDALTILDKLIREEKSCNIVI